MCILYGEPSMKTARACKDTGDNDTGDKVDIVTVETDTVISVDRPTSTPEVRSMFDSIAKTYDLLNFVLSCGSHRAWESKLVKSLPELPSAKCLDLCTGTGALIPHLTKRFSSVVGLDISPQMLSIAKRKYGSWHKVSLIEADAQNLPFADNSFDRISIAYGIRNLPDYAKGLEEISRVLKPGGVVGILEFGQPTQWAWRYLFKFYSATVVPLLGSIISGNKHAYTYLPKTSASFPCGKRFEQKILAAGLAPIRTHKCMGGIAFIYTAQKISEVAS